jgi:hypothetical protein
MGPLNIEVTTILENYAHPDFVHELYPDAYEAGNKLHITFFLAVLLEFNVLMMCFAYLKNLCFCLMELFVASFIYPTIYFTAIVKCCC